MKNKFYRIMELRRKGHHKLLKDLDVYIEYLIERNQSLSEKLEQFNKDDEIQKWKDETQTLKANSLNIMSEKENNAAKVFKENHFQSCETNVQYILEGTGIGTTTRIRCKKCGAVENITDVDKW